MYYSHPDSVKTNAPENRRSIDLDPTSLPAPWKDIVSRELSRLLRTFPRTRALILIGSVADGTWEPDSDIDVVWIYPGHGKRQWRYIGEHLRELPVQMVLFNLRQVKRHFAMRSTMAHALREGIPLYDPGGLNTAWNARSLGLPTRGWIDETYVFMRRRLAWGLRAYRRELRMHRRLCAASGAPCRCMVEDTLCRAVLNLLRLLIVLEGHVPMTKHDVRRRLPSLLVDPDTVTAAEVALRVHHEHRCSTLAETRRILCLWRQLRPRLTAAIKAQASEHKDQP